MKRKLLLTGPPGVGKTTLLKRVLEEGGFEAKGFYTQELREGGRRVGFSVRAMDGREAILAHRDISSGPRVGRYGVNVEGFESLVVPLLEEALEGEGMIVIDEISKMELYSERFRHLVTEILDRREKVLFGVISSKGGEFIEGIKGRGDVEIWEVSIRNRDRLPSEIIERLRKLRGDAKGQ